ncbi:serine hydrolase domain-containing protein [Sphingomonas sp.]|uniref:serine hydrolase domain-containing protein n=1 Tax=Sphingomonas sp. TaxID=28214 RepID=UPI0035BC2A90
MRTLLSLALLLAAPAAAQQVSAPAPSPYPRAIAAGYKAAMLCSGIFNAGRTEAQIEADELRGIYPEYDAIVPTLTATVDRRVGVVQVAWSETMPPRLAYWARDTGCVTMPIGAEPSPLTVVQESIGPAPADPRAWPQGDGGIHPRPSPVLAARIAAAFDARTYGEGSNSIGVIVVVNGGIVAERYRAGFGPFTANRTWSVAKSVAGSIIGAAQARGQIDVTKPAPVPEWRSGLWFEARKAITTDHLLRMASGLHSDTAGNRTDAIYFGGTAVAEQATGWSLEAKPGTRFRYANNDILLAMHALRGAIGDRGHADAPRALFNALGMTHTVAETDWRGDFILSSQVWSTARDLARLGQFWLQDGVWQGKRLLPTGWMRYMTTPSGPQPADGPGYGATMWLFGPKQGLPEGSYAAQGNRGQYVMVIPSKHLVIVRRGEDPGAARFDIARFSADIAKALPEADGDRP